MFLRKSPKVLSPTEIQELQTSSLIYDAFQTFIPKIQSFVTKYSIILVDDKARLLSVYANDRLMELYKTLNSVPGGVWSEELCGTTAFGTPIVVGKPVVIRDAQHFCENLQNLSCAGVPIFHPTNKKTIGVLDLTSFPEDFPSNALVFTQTLAKSIESEVFSQLQIHKLYLENAYLEKELRVANDMVVAVDIDGQIVRSSHTNTTNQQEWNNKFNWPNYFQICQKQLALSRSNVPQELPLPFSSDPSGGRLQLVYYKNRIIGALIQMRCQPLLNAKTFATAYKPGRSNESLSLNPGPPTIADATSKEIIGESPQWMDLLQKLNKIAKRDMFVLLIGESGTGKEVLSQYIHDNSSRKHKPFVAVNCAAFAHDLAVSELFGYMPGTFTGGLKEGKAGLFEKSNGGTVLLDEIAELPFSIQAMLLRVLQEKQVTRIGEYQPRTLDIRVIAATNQDLKKLTSTGKFRLDLYYRLNAVELRVPSLRERKEDIVLMAEHVLRKHSHGPFDYHLMPETIEVLGLYDWPGNVREIKNAMEYAIVFADDNRIFPWHLPEHLVESAGAKVGNAGEKPITSFSKRHLQIADSELTQIMEALHDCRYNITKASKRLGISRGTLYKKIEKYQIT